VRQNRAITVTVPDMTRFMMPLSDSVGLVKYAFAQATQGDLFIRKAPACSLENLIKAILSIAEKPDHPVNVIGWRHGEKLYETLATAHELSTAENMEDYWRIRMDLRGMQYANFFTQGDQELEA
ncbi:unnamed protein product, partial [Cyprideis torosa]